MRLKRLVLVMVLMAAGLARGPGARADEQSDAEARKFYDEGQTQYAIGAFDKAIEAYKKAFELSKRPTLLFNIAQAYRLSQDFKQSKFFYESFLRQMPDAPNRADVEKRIQEMDEAISKAAQANREPNGAVPPEGVLKAPPGGADVTPPADGGPAPVTHQVGKPGLRLAGLITMGGGVVAVGLGVMFGLKAASLAKDVDGAKTMWTDSLSQKESDGKAANSTMVLMYGVGAALIVGGGVMYWLGRPHTVTEAPTRTTWAPAVGPKSAGLVVRGAF